MLRTEKRNRQACPLCGNVYFDAPAISRTDQKTAICPDCGIRQSLDSIGVSKGEQDEIIRAIHKCMNK